MKRYFLPKPIPIFAYLLVAAGFILAVAGLAYSQLIVTIGIVLLASGIIWVYIIKKTNPNDEQYDRWFKEQLLAMRSRGLTMFDLDASKLIGPVLSARSFILPASEAADDYAANEIHVKQGKDGKWRFSINVYTYFYPTQQSLIVFTFEINAFRKTAHVAQAEEYFYRHIAGITTNTYQDSAIIDGREYHCRLQEFSLRISSGNIVNLGAHTYLSAIPVDGKQHPAAFTPPDFRMQSTFTKLGNLLRSMN